MDDNQILVMTDESEVAQVTIDFAQKIIEPAARVHLLNVLAQASAQVLQVTCEVETKLIAISND